MWILAILVQTVPLEVVAWPYLYTDNYQVCMLYKDIEEEKHQLPMTCLQSGDL